MSLLVYRSGSKGKLEEKQELKTKVNVGHKIFVQIFLVVASSDTLYVTNQY